MPTAASTPDTRRLIDDSDGLLGLAPALVARDWLPPGRRLGLPADAYDVGERGHVCERWLASTTRADNRIGPDDEGLSRVLTAQGVGPTLADLVLADPAAIMGAGYARDHAGLGRLAKIFDFAARIPFHIHPPHEQAQKVGRSSKDEAYYFPPGVDMGPHPESFLGIHPGTARHDVDRLLLAELIAWDSDRVLRCSQAFAQVPRDGFFIPSGVLHAPGTAVTVELQEDSDTLAMFQALNAGQIISKELLFKDVSADARSARGEAALLDWVDLPENTDPYFHANHHVPPRVIVEEAGARESWVLYGSSKFSGKELLLEPGARLTTRDRGVFNLLVWQGEVMVGGRALRGRSPGRDELLVVHERAVRPLEYVNTGSEPAVVIKFFGPDINDDSPRIERVG